MNIFPTSSVLFTQVSRFQPYMHSYYIINFLLSYCKLRSGYPTTHYVITIKRRNPSNYCGIISSARSSHTILDAFSPTRDRDPYRLNHIDTYSNILYVKEKHAELSHLAHVIVKV